MRSKYGNRITSLNNITFSSAAEAERYLALKDMQECGEISELELQPEFELLPSFSARGEHYRAIKYRADFDYMRDGVHVVEEIKGFETATWRLKAKLFRYRYPDIDFRVVRV